MIDPRDYLDAGLLLHGHRCPAMPLGLRAGAAALNTLGVDRAGSKELVAFVELGDGHCAHCFGDGVQMVTGCTFGKANIIKLGYGKFGLTVVDKRTGKAVRVVPWGERQLQTKATPFFTQYREKGVSPVDVPVEVVQPLIDKVMGAPDAALFKIGEVFDFDMSRVPSGSDSFDSVLCERCGDVVVAKYAQQVDGQTVCMPCREDLALGD